MIVNWYYISGYFINGYWWLFCCKPLVCNQKGGVHRTHNTSIVANEPCQLNSADLLYTQNSKPSHTSTTDRPPFSTPHSSKMYRHNSTTNLKYPSSSSPLIQVSNKENFHYIYRICTIPKAQAFLTSKDSQNNSFSAVPSLFLFLSNSSATTVTIWLTTRHSGNLSVQPKSPSYGASHHCYVCPNTKLLHFQLLLLFFPSSLLVPLQHWSTPFFKTSHTPLDLQSLSSRSEAFILQT